jgi:hypothetical protein
MSDDGLIYHYTGLSGLMGIVKSGNLFATDIRFLNDTSESIYGLNRIREIIGERVAAEQIKGNYVVSDLASLARIANNLALHARLFVTCFCRVDNLLSQWRGYGPLGYSIGFDRKTIEDLAERSGFTLTDMTYSAKTLDDTILEVLTSAFRGFTPSELGGSTKVTVL